MKIIRPDGSIVEGTPDEIAQYEAFALRHGPSTQATQPAVEEADWEFVSTDVAFRALTRIKLGKETKAVLTRVYLGGEEWTSAAFLQKEIGYTPAQFAGLMGAFGRRLVNTPGYVSGSAFWEWEWDSQKSCYLYRLPAPVRAAVEKARIVP
ncbi:MAG: hypothetical protein QOH04_2202 [Sphingomonadales bacterium]|jgi:hypothetical protein|nr:hypothetical protein [Sphingomonadales bacterium]